MCSLRSVLELPEAFLPAGECVSPFFLFLGGAGKEGETRQVTSSARDSMMQPDRC